MARFLITAEGFSSTRAAELRAAVKASKRKAEVRITNVRQDKVFNRSCLITVSAPTKAGANKVQNILWDDLGCGCVEIEKLPERGYGNRRMGAEIPVYSYMD